jgi:hypothetical protein
MLVATPWRRYGKNRLYVAQPDGTKVGYWDLDTDEGHPASPELLGLLREALITWQGAAVPQQAPDTLPAEGMPPESAAAEIIQSVVSGETWYDLALNKPGQAVREQALAARDEQGRLYTFLARTLDAKTDERAWRVGADGEERVGWVLDRLARKDPRWRFLHSVPVGKAASDIDHVLIGPAGVFTVNTKNHPGARVWVSGNTLQVNGNSQPYIRNSKHERARAAKLLGKTCGFPVQVQALIVLVGVEKFGHGRAELPEYVYVLQRGDLYSWLRKQPAVLTAAGIDTIYEQARRSTTWHT